MAPYPFPDSHAPVGSGIYYAIRFAPPPLRADLSLVNALYRSIVEIPDQCSEAAVAMQKLGWWQRELQRSFGGHADAQHPVATAAARLLRQHGIEEIFFEPLFKVTAQMIGGVELDDEAALERHLQARGASFGQLMAEVAGADADQINHARALGSYLAEAATIGDIGADLRRQRVLIPLSRLERFGVSVASLQTGNGQIDALLNDAIGRARQRYRETLQRLSPDATLGPLLSLAVLAERLLTHAERDGAQKLLQQRIELTPLRKLWICWRCQRGLC